MAAALTSIEKKRQEISDLEHRVYCHERSIASLSARLGECNLKLKDASKKLAVYNDPTIKAKN